MKVVKKQINSEFIQIDNSFDTEYFIKFEFEIVEIDQSEWHIWDWYNYVAIFQRRYLKPWLESLLSWWPAAAQLLSHYISKQSSEVEAPP